MAVSKKTMTDTTKSKGKTAKSPAEGKGAKKSAAKQKVKPTTPKKPAAPPKKTATKKAPEPKKTKAPIKTTAKRETKPAATKPAVLPKQTAKKASAPQNPAEPRQKAKSSVNSAAKTKPSPGSQVTDSPSAGQVPQAVLDFLEGFEALKPGKTWRQSAADLVRKIPASVFGDFVHALDMDTPFATGKISPLLLTGARPGREELAAAILNAKLDRDQFEELVERLRCCLCCCHCWPCRPWPFCRFCRRPLVKVGGSGESGWVQAINFADASVAVTDRKAEVTCGGGGSWAPKTWDSSTPAASAPVGYAAVGHGNDSHSTKFISRTNIVMQIDPDTALDSGYYWVKVPLSLPAGFTPGTNSWAECVSGVCLDPAAATCYNLHALSPSIVTELNEAGTATVNKIRFRLATPDGIEYRKGNGIWAGKIVIVTVAAPSAD